MPHSRLPNRCYRASPPRKAGEKHFSNSTIVAPLHLHAVVVVDCALKVDGLDGLHVIDASVIIKAPPTKDGSLSA
jgi:hypothetical protein